MDEGLEVSSLREIVNQQGMKVESLETKLAIVAEFLARALEAISNVEESNVKKEKQVAQA